MNPAVECAERGDYKGFWISCDGFQDDWLTAYWQAICFFQGLGCAENREKGFCVAQAILPEILKLAECCDVIAQHKLGVLHYLGCGVAKDEAKALLWYRKAAERGYAGAQYNLGWMYSNGRGAEKDDVVAVEWYRMSAEQGNAAAQFNLGSMYANGRGVEKDDVVAVEWYRKAAEQGYARAQYKLGVRYANGRGVEKDEVVAVEWYRKAAEQGNAAAQFNLGCMYADGQGVEKDDAVAVEWYRKAAEQGNARAQNNLGLKYEYGRGVEKDDLVAVEWYRKAVEQGNAAAQFNLGCMYANGRGVEKDDVVAVEWYRKSAEQGYAGAQYILGLMYANGHGVEKDEALAVEWYRKAAEQGYAAAQFNLGSMYANGRGVEKDDVVAVEWYRKAAEGGDRKSVEILDVYNRLENVRNQVAEEVRKLTINAEGGDTVAQLSLAKLYEEGGCVEKDIEQAKKWYGRAAKQGNELAKEKLNLFSLLVDYSEELERYRERVNELVGSINDFTSCLSELEGRAEKGDVKAQYLLGSCYEVGYGVGKDASRAVDWYRKAIKQGCVEAYYRLGRMHLQGVGVEVDYVKAFELLHRAAQVGNMLAKKEVGLCYEYGRGVEINFGAAVKCFREIKQDGNVDLARVLSKHPEFSTRSDLLQLQGDARVEIICMRPDWLTKEVAAVLSGSEWCRILLVCPRLKPELDNKKNWESFAGADWVALLAKYPEYSDKCNWRMLSFRDWEELILANPSFKAIRAGLVSGKLEVEKRYKVCPKCGAQMLLRHRKSDGVAFYGCSEYPQCDCVIDFKGK